MKKLLLLGVVLSSAIWTETQAQVDPIYAQYIVNPLTINPAYAGLNNNLNALVSYRRQWAGFEGSPTTINVSGHTSLIGNRMGLGVMFVQDKIGANKNTEAQLSYAYRLISGKRTLSFGLQGGFINYQSNNAELRPFDPDDPAFAENQNIVKPSFGAGLILHSDRYFLGISIPRLLANTVSVEGVEMNLYRQHVYVMASYVFNLSERLRMKPAMLVRAVNSSPLSIDYNVAFNLDEKYALGLFGRNTNSCGIFASIWFAEVYRLAYTFEVPLGDTVESRFTTHEVSFGINLSVFTFQSSSVSNF
jgi:type IX secretion system PorP/SprF family membrane protein